MSDHEFPDNFSSLGEEWWTAIMADEEDQADTETEIQNPIRKKQRKYQDETGNDWVFVQELLQNDQVEECQVVACNQGGLLVKHSRFQGFVPVSHVLDTNHLESGLERENYLRNYLGKTIKIKVIECEAKRGRIVLSERAALSGPGQRHQLLNSLHTGRVVKGQVTNITDFGVFIDLGGVEGLAHISELSWTRVNHPKDLFEIGQDVSAQVLSVDRNKGRVSLSLKRLLPNPWETIQQRYPPGESILVEVINVVSFGAFVRLQDGLEGLIHISEMELLNGDTPSDILAAGEQIYVELVSVDSENQRLSLKLKE